MEFKITMSNFEHMNETEKLKAMIARGEESIKSLAEKLGIARGTLYTRLEKNNWKKAELVLIKSL